jgi:hypothetical protein
MSPEGLVAQGSLDDLAPGVPFRIVTIQGDVLEGVVRSYVPEKTFGAMVESLNKAILNIEMCPIPGGGRLLYLSLTTWGLPQTEVDALGARLKTIVHGLFPQQTETPFSSCAQEQNQSAELPTS